MHATDVIAYSVPSEIFHPRCAGDAMLTRDEGDGECLPVFASEINEHVHSSCGKCLGPIVED
jgi:hypothetical protein